MKIRKKSQIAGLLASVLNIKTESDNDTYSCNYINEKMHPIGSIYISSTNTNPTNELGGTWELIDKEFAYKVETLVEGTHYTRNNTNCEAASIMMQRSDHNMWLRVNIKNKVPVGDTELEMLTFDFSKMGFNNLSHTFIGEIGFSDGGNGVVGCGLNYSTGVFSTADSILKGNASNMEAGSQIYFHMTQNINPTVMDDSACNKFYWKRTA